MALLQHKICNISFLKKLRNLYLLIYRRKSSINQWDKELNTEIKCEIEKYWSNEVVHKYHDIGNKRKPYYVLPMFPYPSGNLHMGHVRVYSISDTIARFQILNGNRPIHPMGWDAFGLPAENAAIQNNIHPHIWTASNIETMKTQLLQLGINFDWSRELSTCDPKYYKWTQYIFLKLYEKGLAYQSKAQVNWDPIDKTVLADEQVDDIGCSWRSGAKVEKKYLTQWFIKTTNFAKELYDGLDSGELENWKDIINLQKHWIGECNGVVVTFKIDINNDIRNFDVWTSDPYKFLHGDFLTMGTNHVLVQELKDKNKILTSFNPVSNRNIPVYITDDINYPEGRDVFIGCSACDEDQTLATTLNIPVVDQKSSINIESDNRNAIDIALSKNVGGHYVSSKLKDWLVSRQRYWGTPIPIVHCKQCGTVPVPYEELPIELPISNNTQAGIQTLGEIDHWVNCKCPECKSDSKRETDTLDTFVDSSWYYYRFLDPNNDKIPFSIESIQNNIPVDIYIGGKEHAVLHLYYARFMSYFLHSLGWTPSKEPFKKLLVQGMIMGQSYKLKSTGKYVPPDQVEQVGKEYREKDSGEPILVQWEKMSKSKFNGENPQRLISTYGCDTTKLLMLADVPPATSRRWSDATLPGVLNFQRRLWMTISSFLKHRNNISDVTKLTSEEFDSYERKISDSRNYFTATATYHFKYTQQFSVGISRLQSLTSALRNNIPPEVIAKSAEFEKALAALIIMLSPVTPHFCSELWAGFLSAPHRVCQTSNLIDWQKNIHAQSWPKVDEDYALSFSCKVDGADRSDLKIKQKDLVNLTYEKAMQLMLNEQRVKKMIKTEIIKSKFEHYPDCRAILHIFTKRKFKETQAQQNVN